MIIANPIYDSVFKFLMEDNEIAKGLLSAIMEEDIIELEFLPQETSTLQTGIIPGVMRLDFVATILLKDGEKKKVLIELQKSQDMADILRFRKYLGQHYAKSDETKTIRQKKVEIAYPIVTIYFLGFDLTEIPSAVVKVKKTLFDVVQHKDLGQIQSDFVEKLNHDCFIIQILRLQQPFKSELEKLLSVFDQNFVHEDLHKLNYSLETDNPLQTKLVRRLNYAIESQQIQATMDIEDEFERLVGNKIREKEIIIEQKDKALEQKDKELEKMEQEIKALKKLLEKKPK